MSSFVAHVVGQLERLGGVSQRAMFGAVCLFRDGRIFAIVDDNMLFLKCDAAHKATWIEGGGRPFVIPHKDKGTVEMAYCAPPDAAFDDEDLLFACARHALAVAAAPPAKKASAKKASTKKASAKTASTKKASAKTASTKKASTKKVSAKKAPTKKASMKN